MQMRLIPCRMVDAIAATRAVHRPMVHREDHRIALLQRHHLDPRPGMLTTRMPIAGLPCDPNQWPACWSIWTWPRVTAGLMSSDDNPYSESQFKTMKDRPGFLRRFGCIEDARAHCQVFFTWYNAQHCHSGIGHMTPHSVHYGLATALRVTRQETLDAAFRANPIRFKNKNPTLSPMPTAAWINPPPQGKTPAYDPEPYALNY